jgi:putative ABC transport system substrate-binding protein
VSLSWRSQLAIALGVIVIVACAGPLASAPRVFRVGWISGNTDAQSTLTDVLRKALAGVGYVEGRNLVLEARYAEGRADKYASIAAEFAGLKLDAVVTRTIPGALAMKQATSAVPIVMAGGSSDPVADGLVASMARPGGNITGTVNAGPEIAQRRLQLLKETLPAATRIAYIFIASDASSVRLYNEARAAAPALKIELLPIEVRTPEDVAGALAATGSLRPDAVVVGGAAGIAITEQPRILDFLAATRLPSMTLANRTFVDRGALMFFDQNEADLFNTAARYVDQILKGANPAELPIARPTKFDFIINMKTANVLGLTIPPSAIAQATELIQ